MKRQHVTRILGARGGAPVAEAGVPEVVEAPTSAVTSGPRRAGRRWAGSPLITPKVVASCILDLPYIYI
jgi:hypothetical protein